jgi:hypothetical protein
VKGKKKSKARAAKSKLAATELQARAEYLARLRDALDSGVQVPPHGKKKFVASFVCDPDFRDRLMTLPVFRELHHNQTIEDEEGKQVSAAEI